MKASIRLLPNKKLIGIRMRMSLSENKTNELWRSFMPRRKEVKNAVSSDLYSLQVYGSNYFTEFNPSAFFEKWALVEVPDTNEIPKGMESFILHEGLYAVFFYKGSASEGQKVFQHIFTEWMPSSTYKLDNRPHFELLGSKYKNNDPDSEEEIWIPIRAIS